MEPKFEELESLLLAWDAGELDEADIERLREILRSDEEARAYYVRSQMLSVALHLEGDAGLGVGAVDQDAAVTCALEPTDRNLSSGRTRHTVSFWVAAAAMLFVCIWGGWLAYLELQPRQNMPEVTRGGSAGLPNSLTEEATARGVALVTRLVDVQWRQGASAVEVGDALEPGRFAIESGFAQIEFFCGATVILEGPAEMELESALTARVREGRLRTQVPPAARGFSIETADMTVVDLGTEFGLSVSSEGSSVQVFDGEVELHEGAKASQHLTSGQALERTANGEFQPTALTPDQFVDIAGLEARAVGQRAARYKRWKQWSDAVRQDPRLIAYYTMDQPGPWQRRLRCSIDPINTELDGAIVGAGRTEGRLPRKSALVFKRPGDRVRVNIPGEFGSVTFACWVKIDSLDRRYNSLFLTDSYDEGEPHWQVLNTGQLSFSRRILDEERVDLELRSTLSPPFWEPSLNGKWIHLASTFDREAKEVAHYLNGGLLSRTKILDIQAEPMTRIGIASIANWELPRGRDAEQAIRNLNGSIDEFVIFAAALGENEIRDMYENGRP